MDVSNNPTIPFPQPENNKVDIVPVSPNSQPFIAQSNVNSTPNQQNSTNRSKLVPKILIGLFIILLIAGVVFLLVNQFINPTKIVDKKNGFQFTNLQGWKKIPPREGAYLSLATVRKGQFIFSYADVRTQPNKTPDQFISRMLTEDYTVGFTKICQDEAKSIEMEFLGIEHLNIPNTNSYKCKFEGPGTNTNGNILVMEIRFIQKPTIDLLVSTSYQKNLPEEKVNVDRLMSGFQIIN